MEIAPCHMPHDPLSPPLPLPANFDLLPAYIWRQGVSGKATMERETKELRENFRLL